ncbi:MAG: lamin tail domain-containing protein [Candidatus Diapherotrites archaeon]|nr:lamin tail domain-containing protein [Candidatus Diapherotrites archaeon]
MIRIIKVHNKANGRTIHERLLDEYVVLENRGYKPIKIARWKIKDAQGHEYAFPETLANGEPYEIKHGQYVFLITGPGTDRFYPGTKYHPPQYQFYWNRGWFVWNIDGDTASLYDDKGRLVQKFIVPSAKIVEPIKLP